MPRGRRPYAVFFEDARGVGCEIVEATSRSEANALLAVRADSGIIKVYGFRLPKRLRVVQQQLLDEAQKRWERQQEEKE